MRIVVRGAGDIATAVIYRLFQCGYEVIALECENPSAIRRNVAFCQAVYDKIQKVEDVTAYLVQTPREAMETAKKAPAVLVDEGADSLAVLQPDILVDAILAKKNLGTEKGMAPLTIALGPGFEAGKDVDYVIETMRGHRLGRIIEQGSALPNTGVPGNIAGYDRQRVIYSPSEGIWEAAVQIGQSVEAGQSIGFVKQNFERLSVETEISGIVRGMIPDGYSVFQGLKIADVDPRKEQQENCNLISEKGRCIAGSVLELVVRYEKGML